MNIDYNKYFNVIKNKNFLNNQNYVKSKKILEKFKIIIAFDVSQSRFGIFSKRKKIQIVEISIISNLNLKINITNHIIFLFMLSIGIIGLISDLLLNESYLNSISIIVGSIFLYIFVLVMKIFIKYDFKIKFYFDKDKIISLNIGEDFNKLLK